MVSVPPPTCRLWLRENGFAYPLNRCYKCGWRIQQNILDVCTDPEQVIKEEAQQKLGRFNYTNNISKIMSMLQDGTGLRLEDPEHVPLLQMYVLLVLSDVVVDEQVVHDAWAVWTMYTRNDTTHDNLIPFNQLTERTKKLDEIDAKAINYIKDSI